MNLSSISKGKISPEERKKNINFLQLLYTLFALSLLIALIWTSFAIEYPNPFGNGIKNTWWVAIVTGSICLILIILTFFISSLGKSPLNFIIYGIFVLCFMHFVSWLCLNDSFGLVYYALWLLFAVAFAMVIYTWNNHTKTDAIFSMIAVCFACLIVYLVFLMFSEITFIGLLLVMILMMIVGFYLNYEVGNTVRGKNFDYDDHDPWTGAVKIWADGILVFCRFFEMLGRGCCKNKL